jgi:heparan-alpha-glucosaminide N-acetyltransferase
MNSGPAATPGHSRILSVDIFRGLTMLVMIFVNALAGVTGLPWWNYHLPAEVDGITYVDMVFPAFLFIVGMAIPLAIKRRLEKGDSPLRLWMHILVRSLSLVLLGLILANSSKVDPQLTGISESLWMASALVGAVLLWNVYPRSAGRQNLYRILKGIGLLAIFVLLAIFRRRNQDGRAAWLDFSYWEILGLIGWAYLSACILYVPLRKKRWAPIVLLIALCTMNVLMKMGWLSALGDLPDYVWPFETGALASIVMAGIAASAIFLDTVFARTFREKAAWALAYAAVLFAAGWLLTPFGISKIRATPTWCLYCAGSSTLIFLILYWVADVRRVTKWASFVKPAGSNTLLTYLLPDIFYAVHGWYLFAFLPAQGWPGAASSLLFTAFILGWAAVMTRLKVRLQL